MDRAVPEVIAAATDALRQAGAQFAYLHGSHATGRATASSDVDVAAFFGRTDLLTSDIIMPTGTDLLVLDTAPLELAGRVAASGSLILEVDAAARVRWEARTRKIYFDERPRFERSHREFLASLRHG